MFPGPVFAAELLTISRRARYYAMRVLYGMILLFVFWMTYHEFVESRGGRQSSYSIRELTLFASQTFALFATTQVLAVMAITPALVAGTIASEKQRKTLHYLLASTLSGSEIVLGKLLARMLMIFVFLAAGVPMLFLLMFFGGVDPLLILITFGLTLSFALFLASMSIFFSTIMRQARSAITSAYLAMVAVFLAPFAARLFAELYPGTGSWVPDMVSFTSPIINLEEIGHLFLGGSVNARLLRMVVAQTIYSTLFLAYSIWRLRSIAANQTAKPKLVLRLDNRGRASWRPVPRPAIGVDPMMWKERYTSRTGGIVKMLGLLNNLFWAVVIGIFIFEYARSAVFGLFTGTTTTLNRDDLLYVIRVVTVFVTGFWLLGTAVTAASAIASEREDDTWLSLIATDLSGREIVRAKMLGSILRFRWMGVMLLIVWIIGMLGGAIHPLSFVIAIFELAIFLAFAAALGVRVSLTSHSTSRSLAITLGVFVTMNGGYLLGCLPSPRFQVNTTMAGVMPWILMTSLFTKQTLADFDVFLNRPPWMKSVGWGAWPILPSFIGIAIYAVLAVILARRAFSLFDRVADRPRINHDGYEPPDPSPKSGV